MSLINHPQITISFDPNICRLNAIKKAAYKFGDRCYIDIVAPDPRRIDVTLTSKNATCNFDLIVNELKNEVLDQELREVVREETAGIQSLLLAQAFSATNLIDPTGETADFREDVLQISSANGMIRESQSSSH